MHASLAAPHQHPAVEPPPRQRVARLVFGLLGLALRLEVLGQPVSGRQALGLGARARPLRDGYYLIYTYYIHKNL